MSKKYSKNMETRMRRVNGGLYCSICYLSTRHWSTVKCMYTQVSNYGDDIVSWCVLCKYHDINHTLIWCHANVVCFWLSESCHKLLSLPRCVRMPDNDAVCPGMRYLVDTSGRSLCHWHVVCSCYMWQSVAPLTYGI